MTILTQQHSSKSGTTLTRRVGQVPLNSHCRAVSYARKIGPEWLSRVQEISLSYSSSTCLSRCDDWALENLSDFSKETKTVRGRGKSGRWAANLSTFWFHMLCMQENEAWLAIIKGIAGITSSCFCAGVGALRPGAICQISRQVKCTGVPARPHRSPGDAWALANQWANERATAH